MVSRLAIFLPALAGGGAERSMVNLMQGFVKKGIDVDLVLAKVEGPYLSEVPPEVRIVNLGGKRLLLSLPALIGYLRRERPAAMLSVMDDTSVVALWCRSLAGVNTRVVVNVQNTVSHESKITTQGLKRQMAPQLVRLFYPWAEKVVPVSQGVADDLGRMGVSLENVQVIYNPVVTPELFKKAQEPVEHPWLLPGQPPVILGVGRLEKQKDFPSLIRAFAQVHKQHSVRLMILGEGRERPYLETLVQELGLSEEVALPGFVANPYAYMARAAMFVLSSAWEGLPTVLIEAIAVGTPVVSTDCESGPREILENGMYGKLVGVGDIEGLASAIIGTLKKPTDFQALQHRAAEFSIEKVLAQYTQVLDIG